jgi:antirestriction protein ArdC
MDANGSAANRAAANDRAARVLPVVRGLQRSGVVRLKDIVAALDAEGIFAPRGEVWTAGGRSLGGQVRRGEQSSPVVFWKISDTGEGDESVDDNSSGHDGEDGRRSRVFARGYRACC